MKTSKELGIDFPDSWDLSTLGETCSKIGSGATPRGGAGVYVDDGPALIRSQNVYDHEFKKDGLVFLTEDAARSLDSVEVQRGDVLINITGDSILRVAQAPIDVLPARVNQHVAILRPSSILNSTFLQKWLSLPLMKSFMIGHSAGGTRKALTKRDLVTFPIPLPPIGEQRAIAETLGALDDKIESNRREIGIINELVVAHADRILAENKLNATTLSAVVSFNEVNRKPVSGGSLKYVDIASVGSGSIEEVCDLNWADAPSRARRGVSDGDVIYSTVRPNRRVFALLLDPDPELVVSTGFAVMTPRADVFGSSFLRTLVARAEFSEYLSSVAHGSAYPAVSVEAMSKFEFELPEIEQLSRFEELTLPLWHRVRFAEAEIGRLSALRDTLLPELLSGRIRVGEVVV